ncbi:DUF4465 domain-containing protein [Rubripirellula reticaptiva]|uniref:Ice-binding protein C-terminal domain-containing protein n=1 Tax=Rubripirellula reticaptiva TaxID=2528013 RepID=A0A5C6EMU2_9BACT|nr:DUF4465 domain-containing protein [Rubripirellula reticaptiva]TWU49720.1 hypothetical protein Poly59_43440 [Rubripirellula reticaptiva]
MKKLTRLAAAITFAVALTSQIASAETVIDFEDLTLTPGSFYNGNTGVTNTDGWVSGGATFNNSFTREPTYSYWSGWAYSNVTNSTTTGFQNQYASFAGGGATSDGTVDVGGKYAVASGGNLFVNLPTSTVARSLWLNNTTYAALAMRDGADGNSGMTEFVTGAFGSKESYSDMFGTYSLDPDGNDFFRITFNGKSGLDGLGADTGSVTRYLADYRDDKSDNPDALLFGGNDYVLSQWLDVDLSSLGNAKSFSVSLESTDIGPFGANTPSYFAIDNLSVAAVPEPATWLALVSVSGAVAMRRRRKRSV